MDINEKTWCCRMKKYIYKYDPEALVYQPWYWRAIVLIPFGGILLIFFIMRRICKNPGEVV